MRKFFSLTSAVILSAIVLTGCIEKVDENGNVIVPTIILPSSTIAPTIDAVKEGLKIEDLKVGTGTEAKAGSKVKVNYTGTLENGTVFDTSLKTGRTPFEFTIGQGDVIKGWDYGVPGMKVGGKRKLTIPPGLGYGSQANGSIPANSTLIFEIELLEVQ